MYLYTRVYVFVCMCMRTHTSLSGGCVCVQESKSRGDTQGETRRSWEGSGQSIWAPAGGSAMAAQRDRLGSCQRRAKVAFETPPSSSNSTLLIKLHPPHQNPPYSSNSTLLIILHVSSNHARQKSQGVIGKWRLVYCNGHIAHDSASGTAKPAMC